MTTAGPWRAAAQAVGLIEESGATRQTIFAEMTALAHRTGAVNLGQGFPDDEGPASVKQVAVQALLHGNNQYPPGDGIAVLRTAIAAHQSRHYGIDLDPDTEVLVTTGATEALAAALLALVSPGDQVITFEPYYDAYGAIISLAGGQHRTVALVPDEDGFSPDLVELEQIAAAPRATILVLNSPHNPTGMVLSADELATIADIARRHDLIVITDEVYEHLTFDGARHVPIATLAGMRERTLTISSAGKTFSFTGWKVGWATGPVDLINAVRTVKQFLTYASGAPFQAAIAHALDLETTDDPDADHITTLVRSLARRRDLLTDGLHRAGLSTIPGRGSYFVIADATPVITRHGLRDGADLCCALPDLCGVVAVPVSAFTQPGSPTRQNLSNHLRFTFTKSESTITEAVRGLVRLNQRPRS